MAEKRYHTNYYRHRRRSAKPDTKGQKIIRFILSFILFLFLTVVGLSVCAKAVFVSPHFIERSFTSYDYTERLYKDIITYAEDKCLESGIGNEAVNDVLNFECVKQINKAYIESKLGTDSDFSDGSYETQISDIKASLSAAVTNQLKQDGTVPDEAIISGINLFSEDISNYADSRISFENIDAISSFVNISSVIFIVLAIVFSVLSISLMLIIYYIGEKRYRGLKYIAYAFGASGLINFVFALIAKLFISSQNIKIYPDYLLSALMKHIDFCIVSVLFAGIAFFVSYTVFAALTWKLKRKVK